ncbi:5'-AMP-activated serine/threonine-protein kinase catalytic subunit alpha [Octopus bimaculoides]|uniref:5'-AMP-activated serine/threonine-protein kinase catalytic subunit alpha n=1 Tax=Octopus bimaculoides TaxID=37653 RepID=UPI0022E27A8D|nr:5'-AMP-activated serine/threonine-protein kinase catalytic subunit alpha [Octopus bimaculoides]
MPNSIVKKNDPNCSEIDKGYKRVAMVEDFFDIIHGVHVEMDGRGGKHAGQKRTYRAIAETYAFLPREAVTRFLMSCSDCQKRMHLTGENNTNSSSSSNNNNNNSSSNNTNNTNISSNNNSNTYNFTGVGGIGGVGNAGIGVGSIAGSVGSGGVAAGGIGGSIGTNTAGVGGNGNSGQMKNIRVTDDPPIIDFSVPITQTYLNHMRNKGYYYHDDESLSSGESEMSTERTPSPTPNECNSPKLLENIKEEAPDCENGPSIGVGVGGGGGGGGGSATPPLGSRINNNNNNITNNGASSPNNNNNNNSSSINNSNGNSAASNISSSNNNNNNNNNNTSSIITTTSTTCTTTTTNIINTNTNSSSNNNNSNNSSSSSNTTNTSSNNLISTTTAGGCVAGGVAGGGGGGGSGVGGSNSSSSSSSSSIYPEISIKSETLVGADLGGGVLKPSFSPSLRLSFSDIVSCCCFRIAFRAYVLGAELVVWD